MIRTILVGSLVVLALLFASLAEAEPTATVAPEIGCKTLPAIDSIITAERVSHANANVLVGQLVEKKVCGSATLAYNEKQQIRMFAINGTLTSVLEVQVVGCQKPNDYCTNMPDTVYILRQPMNAPPNKVAS